MGAEYVEIDLSDARRVIAAGDVHGCLSLLQDSLREIEYDPRAGDRLILLGDILDRGPDVLALREWLNRNRSVRRLRGNHEDILMGTLFERYMSRDANIHTMLKNGGEWLMDFADGYSRHLPRDVERFRNDMLDIDDPTLLVHPDIVAFARELHDAPVAMRIVTPGGRDVGLVHADVPRATWDEMREDLQCEDEDVRRTTAHDCMWSRTRFDAYKRHQLHDGLDGFDCSVPDVDHVFFGHSITREPVVHSNCSWIDTGSFKHSKVTAVDVDDWISRIAA